MMFVIMPSVIGSQLLVMTALPATVQFIRVPPTIGKRASTTSTGSRTRTSARRMQRRGSGCARWGALRACCEFASLGLCFRGSVLGGPAVIPPLAWRWRLTIPWPFDFSVPLTAISHLLVSTLCSSHINPLQTPNLSPRTSP